MQRADMWIGFEGYKDTGRKLNFWLIDKGQWVVVREALRLDSDTLRKYTTAPNQC